MERKNVNLVELNDFLNERYNGRKIEIICDFLFEYVGKDLNILSETAEFNTSFFISSIIENDEILGFEVAYVPKKVLPEKITNDYPVDYKTCCRRIIFGTDEGFSLESCEVDFFISVSDKIDDEYGTDQKLNYGIGVNRWSYDFSGVMVSSFYGVKKSTFKKIGLESIMTVYDSSSRKKYNSEEETFNSNKTVSFISSEKNKKEPLGVKIRSYSDSSGYLKESALGDYVIDYDYYKLFAEGFDMLEKGLTDFSDRRVILLVECNRLSHDVASIEILKGIYTVPTRFSAYFNLSGDYAIDLPDITFPLHVDHSAYDQHFVVYPKPIEVCKQEIDMLVEREIIDEIQGNVLLDLCNNNCRDLLMSYGFSYGTIKRTDFKGK